jgi:uncharacterized protein YgiM (DUF1202 family)
MLPRLRIAPAFGWLTLAIGAAVLLAPGAGHPSLDFTSTTQATAAAPAGNTRPAMRVASKPDPAVSVKLASLVWLHKAGPAASEPTAPTVEPSVPAKPAAAAEAVAPAPVASAAPASTLVATIDVYAHTSPGNQSPRAFTLSRGERVAEAGSQSNWVEVKTDSGQSGWVYSRYLSARASE